VKQVHPESKDPVKYAPENLPRCPFCDKTFLHETYLKAHVANQHQPEDKKVSCATCGKAFWNQSALKRHKQHVHDKIPWKEPPKRHACNKCERKFPTPSSLKSHLRVHEKEVHNTCPKIMTTEATQQDHTKSHEGKDDADRTYALRRRLSRHREMMQNMFAARPNADIDRETEILVKLEYGIIQEVKVEIPRIDQSRFRPESDNDLSVKSEVGSTEQ